VPLAIMVPPSVRTRTVDPVHLGDGVVKIQTG
jgi:hypothetical protein